jgi:TetR/AcrR family transcriptional repressor of nem operon
MRKSASEAAKTRERIITTAAEKFRENGIVATGLNGLMGAAGLTHGGFYKHFPSKDHLVAEACSHLANVVTRGMVERALAAPVEERLGLFVRLYLSRAHRDQSGSGCGFAALASEIARMGPEVRAAGTQGFREMARALQELEPRLQTPDGEARARVAAATMVGALICSRAVGDPDLSYTILTDARESVLAQLEAPGPRPSDSPAG